jgi:hypothetical protein
VTRLSTIPVAWYSNKTLNLLFESYDDLEDVTGAREYLVGRVLKGSGGVTGGFGTVYEAAVAAAIKRGDVPGYPDLVRMDLDEGGAAQIFKKLDLEASGGVIQAKSRLDGGELTLDNMGCGSDYDLFRSQAGLYNGGMTPVIATNGSFSAALARRMATSDPVVIGIIVMVDAP